MSDVQVPIESAAVKSTPRPLDHRRIKLDQFARQHWFATLDGKTPREAIFEPGFWCHVADKLRPMDRVAVTDDAGTFYAEHLVIAVDRTWARLQELFSVSLMAPPRLDDGDLHVAWAGPHRKWEILRGGKVIGTSHTTRADAEIALAGFAGGRA